MIRFEFEAHNVNQISWVRGKVNLADVITKQRSPPVDALNLSLFSSKISICLEEQMNRLSQQSRG